MHDPHHPPAWFWDAADHVLAQMGRIVALTFNVDYSHSSRLQQALQSLPGGVQAPRLRVLVIDTDRQVQSQFMPMLYNFNLPCLQRLRLVGFHGLENFPTFSSLQELSISQCLDYLDDAPIEKIVAVLLQVVKSTPKLKSLDLEMLPTPFPSENSPAKYTLSPVTLSLLEAINMSRCHPSYELLLRYLELPVVTHADLDFSNHTGSKPLSLSHPFCFISQNPSFIQRLRLVGICRLNIVPTLSSLQELSISQCLGYLNHASVEEIVTVLLQVVKSTSNLKSLHLDTLPTPLGATLEDSSAKRALSTVTLPFLEAIKMSRCDPSYGVILGYLDLPMVAHVDLGFSNLTGYGLSSLSTLFGFTSRTPTFTDPLHVQITFPTDLRVTSPNNPTCLSVKVPSPSQACYKEYIRLFTLCASMTTYVSISSDWTHILCIGVIIRHYRHLQVLCFSSSLKDWLLRDALRSLLKPPEDAMPMCPRLETIELPLSLTNDAISVLEAVMQERVRFGIPIKRIRVSQDAKVRWWEDPTFNFSGLIEFMER
ncbi:hypothetical protein ONZ45_g18440 [Pleurotus djamor]|nr:hypothetical protein ONZ45_g18440 [Pleurotus djamor]